MAERRGESEIMRGEKACGRRGSSTLADLEKSESRAGPVAQRGTIVPRTGGGAGACPVAPHRRIRLVGVAASRSSRRPCLPASVPALRVLLPARLSSPSSSSRTRMLCARIRRGLACIRWAMARPRLRSVSPRLHASRATKDRCIATWTKPRTKGKGTAPGAPYHARHCMGLLGLAR